MNKTTQQKQFVNRELSWLEFNQRVLNEAIDESNPILERLKFLAISCSNLDEFFMVRVGGLHLEIASESTRRECTGLLPDEQLTQIRGRTNEMVNDQYQVFNDSISKSLCDAGIKVSSISDLDAQQLDAVKTFFENEVFSSVSPLAVDEGRFPLLSNQTVNLCFRLKGDQELQLPLFGDEELFEERLLVIPIGKRIPRFVFVPSKVQMELVFSEEVIKHFASRFFHEQEVLESFAFRLTRNADMRVDDEVTSDLVESMEDVLDERTTGECVRLEVEHSASERSIKYLMDELSLSDREVYVCDGPLGLSSLMPIATTAGFDEHKYAEWQPQAVPTISPTDSIFDSIARDDQILFHPYQSYDPVVRLVTEAAEDDAVLAIKQTLYRTSRNSRIIEALQRAAESGKSVTVTLELKARFDEARNISWAKRLEHAGANVVYGVRGLKTHAKATLVVRREPQGIVRYCHFGTGNYNEQTAKLYTDISILTADPDYGSDAAEFFNAITGFSSPQELRKISMAPTGLRKKTMEMIAIEIANAKKGKPAFIRGKFNSLADDLIIKQLYEASQAGVSIELNVRGICCLRPGVKGLSENIRVVSLIDRYLEHARIFHFCHGTEDRVFISSADWMSRNLDKRIELLVPIESKSGMEKMINVLDTYFNDDHKAYQMRSDGTYRRRKRKSPKVSSQAYFQELACKEVADAETRAPISFTPHTSTS